MESTKKEIATTIRSLIQNDSIEERFKKLLGDNSAAFISSVVQIADDYSMKGVVPETVLTAAITAAVLNLPINKNLGYAWIIPYNQGYGANRRKLAQFQMGYLGYVQLALRTNQYSRINAVVVYQNQFKSWNPMTEFLDVDFELVGDGNVHGYCAYFRLQNGFEKLVYWTDEAVRLHADQYSKTYNKKGTNGKMYKSPWNEINEFDKMALKTVLMHMLKKWGILSTQMQKALEVDQSVQLEEGDIIYPDGTSTDDNGNTLKLVSSNEVLNKINASNDKDDLKIIENEHDVVIKKDINLMGAVGVKKRDFEILKEIIKAKNLEQLLKLYNDNITLIKDNVELTDALELARKSLK